MLLDKKKVGTITKIGAVFVAFTFIVMYIPMIADLVDPGATSTTQNQQQLDTTAQIASLEKAIQENPRDLGSLTQLGHAYHDQRIHDKAIATYTKVLELDPKNVNVRIDRAIDYFYSGQVDTATAEALKGIEDDPKHANAHYNLGVFYSSQGKNKEAVEAFETYIKLDPKGEGVQQAKSQIKVLEKAIK